ncbi:MAG: hypothetical protein ABUS48_06130 [Pseudomonadota bacterium]
MAEETLDPARRLVGYFYVSAVRVGVLVAFAGVGMFGLAAGASAQDDRFDACGYTYPVSAYRADILGLRIQLPANNRLVVNGRTVFDENSRSEAQRAERWGDSANGASVGVTRDYVLVRTTQTDCVDVTVTWIFVLNRAGTLVASSRLWSENDAFSRFNSDPEGLTFSSSYYCGEYSHAPAGEAYVFVLRTGARQFVRETRSRSAICDADTERLANAVTFNPMEPVIGR